MGKGYIKSEKVKKNPKFKKDILNDSIDKLEEEISTAIESKSSYNFLINALNQTNLTNANNSTMFQANAIFVLVSPYFIEKFELDGLDLDIKINEDGLLIINNEHFNAYEIKPGVKIFGISKGK